MSWHEGYLERYRKLKSEGKSFFPYAVVKDVIAAFLILCVLSYLACHSGANLEDLADPTDTNYNPRPEWYFLFLFQALKLFPGRMEPLVAIVFPTLALLALFLVPFLDRGGARHPLNRPFWSGLGAASLIGIGYLTWAGYRSPLTNPIMEKDPLVLAGKRLYNELNCSYCHQIKGKGGMVGPRLDRAGVGRTEEWLTRHLTDPQSVVPGSIMPKLNLLDDEVRALVAYMKSMGGGPYTSQAPVLFENNCAVCHRIGKKGGEIGPDLSVIGSIRDKVFIRKYIEDPSQLNPASTMPGFKGHLIDLEIEDISRFLAAQR